MSVTPRDVDEVEMSDRTQRSYRFRNDIREAAKIAAADVNRTVANWIENEIEGKLIAGGYLKPRNSGAQNEAA